MFKENLQTPCILLDLDILERNIKSYQEVCDRYGKELWPMVKTHKSTEIAKMQYDAGAKGFLCGTLDECEYLYKKGINNIMYAYPVANPVNIQRVIKLAEKCNFIIRLDNYDVAATLDEASKKADIKLNYTVIIDSGLHRFGISPNEIVLFVKFLEKFENLKFVGISTHPGHVYGAKDVKELDQYSHEEKDSINIALNKLKAANFSVSVVSSGSTPTYFRSVDDEQIQIYHPGNYVFHDNIQMSIGTATEKDCALTVLATVISHSSEETFIIDAGSKTLGLDKGGHGNTNIKGYGYIKDYPELSIKSLSEEVGIIYCEDTTNIKVGDKIEIIPNHACSVANLTSYLIGYRKDKVEKFIEVDIRGNSNKKINLQNNL